MTAKSREHGLDGGAFTVSLDFELFWGMADLMDVDDGKYRETLLRTRQEVVPRLLSTFADHGIHATWATVGLMMFDNGTALRAGLPDVQPDYVDPKLSAYQYLPPVEADETTDPARFGPSLIRQIMKVPGQEIGSHSFSHYYCLEANEQPDGFKADLQAWCQAATRFDVQPASICFGRNQYHDQALVDSLDSGFSIYRGNEQSWFWTPWSSGTDGVARKLIRFADTYLRLGPRTCLDLQEVAASRPYNLAASRFMRAYRPQLRPFERWKVRRIVADIRYAAKKGRIFHLWWHPQDFADHIDENFEMLEHICTEFGRLRVEHGMAALNMGEVAERCRSLIAPDERHAGDEAIAARLHSDK